MPPEDSLWERENWGGGRCYLCRWTDQIWILALTLSACDGGPEVQFPYLEDERHIVEPLGELSGDCVNYSRFAWKE